MFNFIKKGARLKIIAYLTAGVVLVLAIVFNQSLKTLTCGIAFKRLPIYSVEREEKLVAITFDCAWGNEYTQKLLQEMRLYDIKCTFFTVSFWAEKYAEDLKQIVEEGHEVGTHSKTHSYMSKQTAEQIDQELDYSCKVIEQITGQKVQLFRPPYGDYDDLLIERAEQMGLYTIQWDVDSLDWKDLSASQIAKRVISKVKNGSIILCHNNGLHTYESLPLIFADLTKKGYKFVKVSDLIYKENYQMTVEGRQILKNEQN